MAKVFLRVYNREIESMIEGGQLDEAIAHCQHILKTFPMYIETYRLLGKTFLEARRYTDAADIFQRALMAVPDDFVSHVGMSIIRDDENKLDDSIWHMERAFEVQPSNSAIQGELRRLYGRRDGIEPSKIRLSRDALANMYSQGELFNQAIAEIRSVLTEDPNRPDLQVMLARAYYRSGQKVEAAEMAAALLKKYPYCMDALRILVDVLPGTSRAENTQVYRQRLNMLDPYSSFAINSVFASDQVVDSAVNMERLDYRSGSMPAPSQPDWASSLGIKLNGEKSADNPPDWMQTAETVESPDTVAPDVAGIEAVPSTDAAADVVPDWMRDAGWQESAGTGPDGSTESGEAQLGEPIAKAEIPEWLKSMAPANVTDEPETEAEESVEALPVGEDGIPDWLKPMPLAEVTGEPQGVPGQPIEHQPVGEEIVPDWLQSLAQTGPSVESGVEPEQSVELQSADENAFPDRLQSLVSEEPVVESQVEPGQPIETQPVSEEALPDWLQSLAPEEPVVESKAEPEQPGTPTGKDAVSDWLQSLAAEEPVVEPQVKSEQPSAPSPAGETAFPDWFQSLAPESSPGDSREEFMQPVEPQRAGDDKVPDWYESTGTAEAVSTSVIGSGSSENDVSLAESEQKPSSPEISISEGALPDWLTDLGGQKAEAEAAAAFATDAMAQPVTDTQSAPEEAAPPEPVAQEPVTPPIVSSPTSQDVPFHPTGEAKPLGIGDDAFGWLESLAAKQGAKPEELLTRPQDRSEEMPEWLRETDEKPGVAPESPLPEQKRTPAETLPLEPITGFAETYTSQPDQVVNEVPPVREETPLPESISPAAQPVEDKNDTMDWLEQLSTDQSSEVEQTAPNPESGLEAAPDWIQKVENEQPGIPAPEEALPDALEAAADGTDITITSWLSKLDVDDALEKRSLEGTGDIQPAAPEEELPDWLKDLEKPTTPLESPKAGSDLPEWLRHPIPPAELETSAQVPALESEPEVEQGLPAWIDENVPVTGQAAPTIPEEWVPAEMDTAAGSESEGFEKAVPVIETPPIEEPPLVESVSVMEESPTVEPIPIAESRPVPVQVPNKLLTLKQTGMLSQIPVLDKDAELLSNAQTILDKNSLDEAMKQYSKLIKKGRLLDEVIHDLREALYRYPVDVIVWQTLGDAYMRANRLQDALDSYTKAEELLR